MTSKMLDYGLEISSPGRLLRVAPLVFLTLILSAGCGEPGSDPAVDEAAGTARAPVALRLALFNIRELAASKLPGPGRAADPAVEAAVEIVRRIRPDVLVVQEIDQGPDADPASVARSFAALLGDEGRPSASEPLEYPHVFAGLSNTGRLSGVDLDGDGQVATAEDRGSREHGNDAFGFGTYPGQYSMAVLSRFPLDRDGFRSFQRLRWKDLPGNLMEGAELSSEAEEVFRLSSKSHWDLPVVLDEGGDEVRNQSRAEGRDAPDPGRRLHLLISHPTPPGFDGPEDRNGRRNFDEIRLWVEYLRRGVALPEDGGGEMDFTEAGSPPPPFVVVGDLNARPDAEDSIYEGIPAIEQLLRHPWIQESGSLLTSAGGVEAASSAPDKRHPERSTAVFQDGMRIDYLLPSRDLEMKAGGVFWPVAAEDAEGAELAERASDHRLVWLDLLVP